MPGQPTSTCFVRSDIRENVLLHVVHEYFLISEWVWRWARKLDRSANARWQCWQLNGFSPVCVLIWPCNSHGRLKALPQISHLHGSVCVRICIFKAPLLKRKKWEKWKKIEISYCDLIKCDWINRTYPSKMTTWLTHKWRSKLIFT